jgi:hypothetical protein
MSSESPNQTVEGNFFSDKYEIFFKSSVVSRYIDRYVFSNVSMYPNDNIFRIKQFDSEDGGTTFLRNVVTISQSTNRNIPDHPNLCQRQCDNLKS